MKISFIASTTRVKTMLSHQTVDLLENVDLTLKGHMVTVKGPRGTLKRDYNHVSVELSLFGEKREEAPG